VGVVGYRAPGGLEYLRSLQHDSQISVYLIFSEPVCETHLAILSALGIAASQHVEFGVMPFCVDWAHLPGSPLESFGHNETGRAW
jgi:hypothetical protein